MTSIYLILCTPLEHKRLEKLLEENEGLKFPNVPTYGSLIKAFGILRNREKVGVCKVLGKVGVKNPP